MTTAPTIFDREHYVRLIEARGETIRRIAGSLRAALGLETAADVGCGVGFFAEILRACGFKVTGFDGRQQNIDEARRRFPLISFEQGNIESPSIREAGKFDLVLCFGLLYHLENPLLSIRQLHALSTKVLMLESMCFPERRPWMLLREEEATDDQSLTRVAFYPTESCLIKMLYRAGFAAVHRVDQLPDHDDFRETSGHFRRRTILVASQLDLNQPGLVRVTEPPEESDPWKKGQSRSARVLRRAQEFMAKPNADKMAAVRRRVGVLFGKSEALRLPFGARWLLRGSVLDDQLASGKFERQEAQLVERFLQNGMTVLDIGAHHGFYTLLASKCVGAAGRVIAFEPSPREGKRLKEHVRINGCTNVKIETVALGNETGSADLFIVEGQEDWCNSMRPPNVPASTNTVTVSVTSVDAYLGEKHIDRVDFVKLDVEGAELNVLKGAAGLLRSKRRPVILVEVFDIRTEPWGYRAREIVQLLARFGYRWFDIKGHGVAEEVGSDLDTYDRNLVAVPEELVQNFVTRVGP